jgi:hypothetical protein
MPRRLLPLVKVRLFIKPPYVAARFIFMLKTNNDRAMAMIATCIECGQTTFRDAGGRTTGTATAPRR